MKKSMGVGTVWLMIASIAGVLSSYLIHVGLARHLGPALYGVFGVIMSLYQINRAFLHSGIPKATSKYLGESNKNNGAVLKTSIWLQGIVAVIFATFYILFSPTLAKLLRDPSLTGFIVLLGFMIIPFAFLFLYFDGYLNGLRRFKEEALGKILFAVLRVVMIFSFVFLGLQIFGALLGYFTAILLTLIISLFWFKLEKFPKSTFSPRKLISFSASIIGSSLFLLLMRNIDTLLIKSLLADNVLVGYYTAALTLSNVPYIIFSAVGLTLLPSISKSTSENNLYLTRKYISQSMRYLILGLFPVAAIVAASSTELVTLLFSPTYSPAGSVLSILILSTTMLVIFMTLSMVITGSGKPNIYMLLSFIGASTLGTFGFFLIPVYGIMGAAWASFISALITSCIAAIYIQFKFHVLIPFLSAIRITLASLLLYAVTIFWHPAGLLLLLYYFILLFFYLIILYLFGELQSKDLLFVKKLMGK
jgi:O-antigen/teichoic acid export membrane protein